LRKFRFGATFGSAAKKSMKGVDSMKAKLTHRWDLTVEEAMRLQWELSAKVVEEDELPETVRYIAGADVHQIGNDQMQAVVCVLTFLKLELVEVARATVPVTFPYVPGLLAFRESPAVLKAFEQLRHDPDIALFDAQGRAHPRHFGLACHMGVLLDLPSIGCAKSRLYGQASEVGEEEGSMTPLRDPIDGRILGMVVRTKRGSPPLYVSVGHKVSLETAVEFVLKCTKQGQRIPEPLRLAHLHARQRPLEPPKTSATQGTLF
jgi:deoxyribonuclease V